MDENFTKNGADNPITPWANKQLDYYIASRGFTSAQKADIQRAASNIQSYACVTLKRLSKYPGTTSGKNYVYIRKDSGTKCSADVGMKGGRQIMTLSNRCFANFGTIEHEFLHALGFRHEHQRPDR